MTDSEPTVVIVEDEESLADLYAEFLSGQFKTKTVYSGESAFEEIDETVDLVLLDRRMPGTSGDEVLKSIRERDLDCQVVMVTAAYPDFEIVEVGFDNYVVKPIDRDELIEVVERTLAQGRYEEHLREFYDLAARKSQLEARLNETQLGDSPEYSEVSGQLNRIRDRIDDLLEDIEGPGFIATVERTQSVAVLRDSEERFRSMTEEVLDTSDVGTVIVNAEGRIEWLTASMEEYFDLDRETTLQRDYPGVVRESLAPSVADGDEFAERLLTALESNDRIEMFQCRVESTETVEGRWLKHWSKPIEHGLFAGGRIEHYYDVTTLKRREQTLQALHDATRQLIDAESAPAVGDRVVDMGVEILDAETAVFYLREDDSGSLSPTAIRCRTGDRADPEAVSPGDGLLWETFIEGDSRQIDEPGAGVPVDDGQTVLLRPVGTHGLIVLGFEQVDAMPPATRPFAEILAANTEVTLDRTARERALRERDAQLERRNDQLRRLNRINTAIRSIGQGLIDASTRSEIEQSVCDRLSRIDSVQFVWMGEPNVVTDRLTPTASAGDGGGYLEDVSTAMDDEGEQGLPAVQVAVNRTPVIVDNLIDETESGRWQSEALNRGFQSLVAIPVVYEESLFGVVELYADRPSVFGPDEGEVLAELGETIGHGINAINRRDALLSDNLIELDFSIEDESEDFFARLAAAVDRVDLRTIAGSDEGYIAFFVVPESATDSALEVAEDTPGITDVHVVRRHEDETLLKCSVGTSTAVTVAADNGANPSAIRADGNGLRLTVLVPRSTDVRRFHQRLTEQGLQTDLVARRTRSSDEPVKQALNERIDGNLTDRQRESLQSAFLSGYFDWPREANGQEVADALGIDQSTFQQHLRAGQRHVFETLFDSV